VSTLGPGQQDDFHHPNHTVLSGEYGLKDLMLNDDGEAINLTSTTDDDSFKMNTPNYTKANDVRESTLQDHEKGQHKSFPNTLPIKSSMKQTLVLPASKPSAKDALFPNHLNEEADLLGNLPKRFHRHGHEGQSNMDKRYNPILKPTARSASMGWRQSAVDLQKKLVQQRNTSSSMSTSIQGDSGLGFEKTEKETRHESEAMSETKKKLTFSSGGDQSKSDEAASEHPLSAHESGSAMRNSVTRNSNLTVRTSPSPYRNKTKPAKSNSDKKVDVWVTIALGVHVDRSQVRR
jgi:hypothetical protein